MKRQLMTVMVLAVALMASSAARVQAVYINGSMALTGLGLSQSGADLSVSNTITMGNLIASNNGLGDYAGVTIGTSLSNGSSVTLDLNNLSGFTFSSPTWGTFVADNTAANQIIQRSASFLDVYLRGTFTPGTAISSLSPTDTSFRMSFNQSGPSISSGFTLNSPAVNVPEPAAFVMLGQALVVGGLVARRRRNRKA